MIIGTALIKHFHLEDDFKINSTVVNAITLTVHDEKDNYSIERNIENEITDSVEQIPNENQSNLTPHEFNPNIFNRNDWLPFTQNEKLIHTIENFIDHNGHFNNATDLLKVYGFDKLLLQAAKPYLTFDQKDFQESNIPKTLTQKLDLNSADSVQLDNLKGVSNYTASKIVRYRNKLGGYYSIDQLKEIYSLKQEYLQPILDQVQVSNNIFRFININSDSAITMAKHPYLTYKLANAIVNYRIQHGSYGSVNDLKKIELMPDSTFEKIKPYLHL